MSLTGQPVLFRADPKHLTETQLGFTDELERDADGKEIAGRFKPRMVTGSVYHRELTDFAGQVTRSRDDGTHDLVIFPPGALPRHVDAVAEGSEPGTFAVLAVQAGKVDPAKAAKA